VPRGWTRVRGRTQKPRTLPLRSLPLLPPLWTALPPFRSLPSPVVLHNEFRRFKTDFFILVESRDRRDDANSLPLFLPSPLFFFSFCTSFCAHYLVADSREQRERERERGGLSPKMIRFGDSTIYERTKWSSFISLLLCD